jgi:hypothetical protein
MVIKVDAKKMAEEVKKYINLKKMDCVDYGFTQIEVYIPRSKKYPEAKKFSDQWLKFFEETDKALNSVEEEPGTVTFQQVLSKYKPDLAKDLDEFDKKTKEVENLVNNDKKFWKVLREAVIPLYEKSPHFEAWKTRWQSISLSFDPTPLQVVTTQMWTNKETGERTSGDVLRKTDLPEGFVIKIN